MNLTVGIKYFRCGNVQNYNQLCAKVLLTGTPSTDRTGVGTVSLFGEQLRFNLQEGFPAVTTKKIGRAHV